MSETVVSTGSKKYKLSAILVINKGEEHINYLKKKSIMSSLQKLHERIIFEKWKKVGKARSSLRI